MCMSDRASSANPLTGIITTVCRLQKGQMEIRTSNHTPLISPSPATHTHTPSLLSLPAFLFSLLSILSFLSLPPRTHKDLQSHMEAHTVPSDFRLLCPPPHSGEQNAPKGSEPFIHIPPPPPFFPHTTSDQRWGIWG